MRQGCEHVGFNPSISTLKSQNKSVPGDRVLDVCEKDVNALKALYRRSQAFVAQAKVPRICDFYSSLWFEFEFVLCI